jgi:hypothetical protein
MAASAPAALYPDRILDRETAAGSEGHETDAAP